MSGFTDVEQFVREHRSCGTLTPRTSAPVGGAYLLMVSCSCGKTFERWVNVEESEGKPLVTAPPAAPEPPRPEPPAIDITTASATNESLEDVMKEALDALDTPKPPPARTAPTAPAPPAWNESAPSNDRAPKTGSERRDERARQTESALREPSPPSREPAAPPAPPRPAPPRRPPAPAPPTARESEPPKPDRSSLEEALRATLDALGDDAEATLEPETRPTSPATRPRPISPGARAQTQPPAAKTPSTEETTQGGRPKPDKQALQDVLRATLTALEAERKTTPRGAGSGAMLGPLRREPPPRRRKLSIAGAVAVAVALVAAVGAGYGLSILGHRAADGGTASAKPPPRVRVAASERAVVAQTLSVLRDLQSVSRVDVPYRVYFNRVSFAKGDVERSLSSVKDADIRAALNETMELHVLAASAWRAKTLNERDKWEAVGDDPTVELCPAAKRILAVSDEPANISRSQWRGMALAAGVPLLWDCAAERLAEVERGLNSR